MARENYINRVVIVGASGKVGASALSHLLSVNPDIRITILSREDSSATFPSSARIAVRKGPYDDAGFLQSVFADQDLVVFALNFLGMDVQIPLFRAAARAGVKWILPTEYSFDGRSERMAAEVPLFHPKVAARREIEELAKEHTGLKWIAVVTNPWTELSTLGGLFGINIQDRTATFYKGAGFFNSSSLNQVGLGIANLISLPIQCPSNPRASLQHYADNYAYISSFHIDQAKLFQVVKNVTSTQDSDWKIDHSTIPERIQLGKDLVARGDFLGGANLVYAYYMGEGLGGDYEAQAQADRAVLNLQEEDLATVIKGALANPEAYVYAN